MKTAVIIYNLGGPCCTQAIQPFLFNLFNDPAIISLPNPFRGWLAKFISSRRMKKASKIYDKMGGGSPILPETYSQAKALEESLSTEGEYKVFVYMRYSYPDIQDTINAVEMYKPDRIITVPLYPQYSTTTTESSITQWDQESTKSTLPKATHIVSYETNEHFINAYTDLLLKAYKPVKAKNPIILFSAHGIPLNRVAKGDPYEKHVNLSTKAIMQNLPDAEYLVCYQSKVGPLKWLGPSTEESIEKYSEAKRSIILVPVSFVSEHSETLVELDIDYKELATSHGAESYIRVPTVRTHPEYIKCLKQLVLEA